jgi:hypothetical protein
MLALLPLLVAPGLAFVGCGGSEASGPAGSPTAEVPAAGVPEQVDAAAASTDVGFDQDLARFSTALGTASATLGQSLASPGADGAAAMEGAAGTVREVVGAMRSYTVGNPEKEKLRAIIVGEGEGIATQMDTTAAAIATGDREAVASAAEGLSDAMTTYAERIAQIASGQG